MFGAVFCRIGFRVAARVLVLLAAVLISATAIAHDQLAGAKFTHAPPLALPGYLQPATDPVFQTGFTRVTAPTEKTSAAPPCAAIHCTHRYSSAQAWNADQSLLVIVNGCNGMCFLDGRTFQYKFSRHTADECEWHPTDASRMICVSAYDVYSWNPVRNAKTVLFRANGYGKLQFGPYKGNLSFDGNKLVLRAITASGALVAFAYDLATKTKYPDIDLSALPGKNGYCSISPSGQHIFCPQTLWQGTETAYIFALDGRVVQLWSEHHRPGHGDMTIDADGHDVYVGISKADPDKYHVIKRRLHDGAVTDLAPFGESQHASTRNIKRPGWVYLSYAGTAAGVAKQKDWAPFYQEVVALKIDGSGEMQRIAQTRNAPDNYWSETHASPSPDGSMVIWSSNWGQVGGPVSDFVSRIPVEAPVEAAAVK
jgi:hypothetical protein